MRRTTRIAAVLALAGALLLAGCASSGSGEAKGAATGKPTVYEFSTQS